MLHRTLAAMADGGSTTRSAGFARYAIDAAWRVPLREDARDNALLGRLYARAWQLTGDDRLAAVSVAPSTT